MIVRRYQGRLRDISTADDQIAEQHPPELDVRPFRGEGSVLHACSHESSFATQNRSDRGNTTSVTGLCMWGRATLVSRRADRSLAGLQSDP